MVRLLLGKVLILLAKLVRSKKPKLITERVLGLSRSFSINNSMADTKISQLPVATTVAQSEYILIDNGVVTRITPVVNLSSLFATNTDFNNLSSDIWNNTYTTVNVNSGSWMPTELPATALVKANSGLWDSTYSTMYSNSANWNNTYSNVNSNSANWSQGNSAVNSVVIGNSANWSSTYSLVNSTSSSWVSSYNTDYTLTNTICAYSTKERFEQDLYVDIRDYGAKGDGVTDDWLAIQRAIYAASSVVFGSAIPAPGSGTWKYPNEVVESDTYTYNQYNLYTGVTHVVSRPQIWASQGVKTVYIPEGNFAISKPLVITHGTRIQGNNDKSTLILSAASMCNFIESMNHSLTRLYPNIFEAFDEYNANAGISDLSLRRKLGSSDVPYSDPDKKDWLPINTFRLSAFAGTTTLSGTRYTGDPIIPTTDFQIKLLHEYGTVNETTYNVIKTDAREVTIDPPLTTDTPLSGTRFLLGFPAQNGIFTSGGENYTISNVHMVLGQTSTNTVAALSTNQGAGVFIYRGSPGTTIINCMVNLCEVCYWIEEGPTLLLRPSGDYTKTFVRSGMLRFSLPNIISPKIEKTWGNIFEFGSNQGSDNCSYIIAGGQVNSTGGAQLTAGSVIVAKGQGTTSDARIIVDGFRAYVYRQNYISAQHKYDTTIDLSTLNIPKSASAWGNLYNNNIGGYPYKFYWDGTKDLNMLIEKASTTVKAASANWQSTYTTVSANSAAWSQNNTAASGAVNSLVMSSSASWNNTYTTVSANSANWNSAYAITSASRVPIDALTTSYTLTLQDSGRVKTTSFGAPITAYISPTVNVDGFNTSVAQLSTGTITIALCASYTAGRLISYGNLYQTGGQGAIANILRADDNTFLITGLLQ